MYPPRHWNPRSHGQRGAPSEPSGEFLITPWRAAFIAVLCLAAAGVSLWFPAFRTAAFVLLFLAAFLVGSAFSVAGRTARSLQFLRGGQVRVLAWGLPLPASDGPFYVESIASLGVGLLIRLQAAPGAKRTLLKIAQPRDVVVSVERVTIGRAAYVQWSGRRLKRVTGDPLPALALEPVPNDLHGDFGASAA
jgi:hypothetical protein